VTLSTAGELSVTLTDNSVFNLGNVKGPKGDKGDKGDTGATGPQGEQGATGAQGPQGETGATGAQGPQGEKGDKGDKGDTGEAGRGIDHMEINDNGELVVYYTDGTNQNLGSVGGGEATDSQYLIFSPLADGTYSVAIKSDYRTVVESLNIPEEYEGKKVTQIATEGFAECTNLKTITFPDTIKEIGKSAFQDCSLLENVILPHNISIIGEQAFQNCSSIQEITIPSTVSKISTRAFYGCSSLSELTLNEGLQEISYYAFSNTTALKNITIPASTTTIGYKAFYGSGISTVIVQGNNSWRVSPTETGNMYFIKDGMTYTRGYSCDYNPNATLNAAYLLGTNHEIIQYGNIYTYYLRTSECSFFR